ncbi:GNAT family N-acetyltransferase [Jiella sp. CBK1P-4]|uniref:GNAT family N-acetyltransferase n=2 Tax=Jiella avicenniae TaxID=2907202 RepID=A0A9X1NZK7_9HYPH|nr:GNAT family N-acetyltransferase [Jiella avicenniae]
MRAPIVTLRTRLRPWAERNRPAFHRLNSDETVMRFFPFRRSQRESDALLDDLNRRLEDDGYSFLALEVEGSRQAVGMVGMARLDPNMPGAPGVEIGWRLLPEAWGMGFATEAAAACLDRAFAGPDALDEVVSFCVANNGASEAVMLRLGFSRGQDFDHPKVPAETHPELVRHRFYRLSRSDWLARRQGRPADLTGRPPRSAET